MVSTQEDPGSELELSTQSKLNAVQQYLGGRKVYYITLEELEPLIEELRLDVKWEMFATRKQALVDALGMHLCYHTHANKLKRQILRKKSMAMSR